MKLDFWTFLAAPLLVGLILLTIEYFLIQPTVKRRDKRIEELQKRRLEDKKHGILKNDTEKELRKVTIPKTILNFITKKFITFIANIKVRTIILVLVVFTSGITFTIYVSRVTNTNLAIVGMVPTSTPTPRPTATLSPTPTPKLGPSLFRRNSTNVANIIFVVNTSSFMSEGEIQQEQQALFEFRNRLLEQDNVSIIAFSDQSNLVMPLQNVKTSSKEFLGFVNSIQKSGSISAKLYSTLIFAIDQYENSQSYNKNNIVVVISNPYISDTKSSQQAAKNYIQSRPDVKVLFVGLGDDSEPPFFDGLAKSANTKLYTWMPNENSWWINDLINSYLP